jgi:hypothetical protein
MPDRRELNFDSVDALIADVERLRRGYTRAGNWSLAQACWHLRAAMEFLMRPGPYPAATPEQEARRPMVEGVLATGRLPTGIQAPETVVPPADCTDADIDGFVERARLFNAHPGPYAPHRLFGQLAVDEMRRLQLIHAAHHLSYLVPDR